MVASLSKASAASSPWKFNGTPNRSANRPATWRTARVSGPVTLITRGGVAACSKRSQRDRVGVGLPDHVEISHGQVDRLSREHLPRQVHQHAIAHFDGIIQANHGHGNVHGAAEMIEDTLAAQAAHRVLADRNGRVGLFRSTPCYGHEAIDIAGREGNDAAAPELEGDECRQQAVYGPCLRLHAGRPEFHREHRDDVGQLGKLLERIGLEQIATDRLDTALD